MANPNIVATTIIKGVTQVMTVGILASKTIVTTNAASSGKVFKVNTLMLSNYDSTTSVAGTAAIRRGGTDFRIAESISIPPNTTIVILGKENPIYLQEGDSIVTWSSLANSCHVVCSYEEIS